MLNKLRRVDAELIERKTEIASFVGKNDSAINAMRRGYLNTRNVRVIDFRVIDIAETIATCGRTPDDADRDQGNAQPLLG